MPVSLLEISSLPLLRILLLFNAIKLSLASLPLSAHSPISSVALAVASSQKCEYFQDFCLFV